MRKSILRILHAMQKWRRGQIDAMPYTPFEFGMALDDCIRILRKLTDEQVNEILNGKERYFGGYKKKRLKK